MKKVFNMLVFVAFILFFAAASSSDAESIPFEYSVTMALTGLLMLCISVIGLWLQKKRLAHIKLIGLKKQRNRFDAA